MGLAERGPLDADPEPFRLVVPNQNKEVVFYSTVRVPMGTEDSGIFSQEDIEEMKTRGIEVEVIGFGVALFQRLHLPNPNRVDF